MLEVRRDVEGELGAGSSTSSAPSRGVCVATGEVWPASVPSSTRAVEPPRWTGEGTWWAKSRGRCRAWSGSATHSWTPCRLVVSACGDLGVRHAVPAGHQVQLAGPDHRVHAAAVAVLDLAGEQPADRLQAGVRVRGHVHPAGVGDVVGAVVVGEAPGADQRAGRWGSVRRTVIARGPPSGTSRLVTTWTSLTDPRWHSSTSRCPPPPSTGAGRSTARVPTLRGCRPRGYSLAPA